MYDKLTIQERIRDLRYEKRLTLEELSDKTGLSKSALGSYESNDTKDISHYAIMQLAKFYGVTTDYLLGLSGKKQQEIYPVRVRITPRSVRIYPIKSSTSGF